MLQTISKSKLFYLLLIYYFVLVWWWIHIYFSGIKDAPQNYYYGFFYAFIALAGGLNGLFVSRTWGGFKSLMGKAVIFMSIGLLLECFGQFLWSYYNIVAKVEMPFPSMADIGYFLMIPSYTLGALFFAKAAGAKYAFKELRANILTIIGIPAIMLIAVYFLLLQSNTINLSSAIETIRTFLNYYSPIGEGITISIAILSYILFRKYLGGSMKSRILFILFALVIDFLAGMTFLYQAATGTYYNGGINDLMFTTSFAIMAIGLLTFKSYE